MRRGFILFLALSAISLSTVFLASANINPAKNVTFSKDVAPIFFAKCAECHRTGEVAPFSVLSYKEARPWAKSIREKVVDKTMPPWHADPNHGSFKNDRRLSQAEIDTIVAWVDQGAKEGNAKDLPPAPKYYDGWTIGKPDQTFSIPEQTFLTEGVEKYRYLQIPTEFKEDRWIQAAEIRSSGRSAVHHVIVFVQAPGTTGTEDGSLLAGTAPGEQPTVFPVGFGKKIPAGSKLTFQMHYTPNGKDTKDITTIGLIYAKETPRHEIKTRPIMNPRFVIPPGADNYEVQSAYTFKEDIHVTSFMPHMHLRGKDFVFKAISPDGAAKILLNVPTYDFAWQTYYVPTEPIAIAKGTKIECVAHFDNSKNNKYNPDPTKEVRWGDQTWEEMMIGWVSYYYDHAPPAKSVAVAK
jgi:hypothetical protein